MSKHLSARPLVAIAAALLLISLLASASAQKTFAKQDRPVSIKMENMDIRMALKLLFDAGGESFTLAPEVKGSVTLDLKEVPFRVALRKVLDASGQPLRVVMDAGVFDIRPDDDKEPEEKTRTIALQLNYVNGADLVRRFSTDMKGMLPKEVNIVRGAERSMIVQYKGEDAVRELKEIVRLLDVRKREVEIRAELVVISNAASLEKPLTVLYATARAITGAPVVLTLADDGAKSRSGGSSTTAGRNTLRATPVVMGDGAVDLQVAWELDMQWRPEAGTDAVHIKRSFSGKMLSGGGKAVRLTSSPIQLPSRSGKSVRGEIALYLTARQLPDVVVRRPTDYPGVSSVAANGPLIVLLNAVDRTGRGADRALADAMTQELLASQRFEIAKPADVSNAEEQLGLRKPYNDAALVELASASGANEALIAELRPAPSKRLSLVVRSVERWGLRRSASVPLRGTSLSDLRAASRAAIQALMSYEILEGTILATSSGTALLNRGAYDGLSIGTELVVMHDGVVAGRLKVQRLYPSSALAKIISGARVVRTEDIAETYLRPSTASR